MRIEVAPTPAEFTNAGSDAAVIVIDVFRASTTIVTALAGGAKFVLPTVDVEQAVRIAAPYDRGEAILGGERESIKIEGFALGNSPREYTRETVGGKAVILTTSNGTRALLAAREAGAIYVGCFINMAAVVAAAARWPRVSILCAGNAGRLSLEDYICAGGFVEHLARRDTEMNDAAAAARAAWMTTRSALRRTLLASDHARLLAELGCRPDMELALKLDSTPVVPVFSDGRVTIAEACLSPSPSV